MQTSFPEVVGRSLETGLLSTACENSCPISYDTIFGLSCGKSNLKAKSLNGYFHVAEAVSIVI
jgi:hypothetical protein